MVNLVNANFCRNKVHPHNVLAIWN